MGGQDCFTSKGAPAQLVLVIMGEERAGRQKEWEHNNLASCIAAAFFGWLFFLLPLSGGSLHAMVDS